MSFKEVFNSKNPLLGGPDKKKSPKLKTTWLADQAVNAYLGEDNTKKAKQNVNKLIDLYNARDNPNEMTDKEREYRTDVVNSFYQTKPGYSLKDLDDEGIDEYLKNLDTNVEEFNTNIDVKDSPGWQAPNSQKQKLAIALDVYDQIEEEERLFEPSDVGGWKIKNMPNLTDREKKQIREEINNSKSGNIDFNGLMNALEKTNSYALRSNVVNKFIQNDMLDVSDDDYKSPVNIYVDENDNIILEQKAKTSDDLKWYAKPFVDMDNLKEIEESGIIDQPNIKFRL
tara:strand:+ start:4386 stop:5237 length:852 start_codon:yes stop_codon:yes gene_type:complete